VEEEMAPEEEERERRDPFHEQISSFSSFFNRLDSFDSSFTKLSPRSVHESMQKESLDTTDTICPMSDEEEQKEKEQLVRVMGRKEEEEGRVVKDEIEE
jgi:hypothetical protein